jgi:hypothetical protein
MTGLVIVCHIMYMLICNNAGFAALQAASSTPRPGACLQLPLHDRCSRMRVDTHQSTTNTVSV